MGQLMMSDKERERKVYMEMVKQGTMTLVKASNALGMSYRQAQRVYKAYLTRGDPGLIHRSRGRSSNREHPKHKEIIARYKERYWDFGPTFAAEKLAEADGLIVDHETLRRWLLKEKLWKRRRKRSPHRQWREPKAQFGEMLQLDGSFHDWFENQGNDCLLDFVDDATSHTMARLESAETTAGIFKLLWQWIETHGVPMSIYVDLKTVYVSPKQDGFSYVEVACKKLGIRVIKAYSAQAKGRVERKHGVYQDRFIKELRLAGIKEREKANVFLNNGYLDKLNNKFAKPARDPKSAHRQFKGDLNQVLCWEYTRQIQNDWTISLSRKYYQIGKPYGVGIRPKSKITVRHHLDGGVSAWYKGVRLPCEPIAQRPQREAIVKPKKSQEEISRVRAKAGKKGKQKSPWSQFSPGWLTVKKTETVVP